MPRRSSTPAPALAEEQPEWQSDLQVDIGRELKSVVDSILQTCPKFRILILGRSGVGKSSLINAIFGTDFTTVEHGRKAGISNIEKEITSPQNSRLVLHDSQGFCHGSGDNFNLVKNFIATRSLKTDLKDKLHAIWLCSAVPTYGDSLLEVGEEEILQMKDCNVPIVAVFTKYDVLVESLNPQDEEDFYGDIEQEIQDLDKEVDPDMGLSTGASTSQIDPDVLSLAEKTLCEIIAPFKEKLDVPWVKVSANNAFSDTLDELVDVTEGHINDSLELLWAITQQQSAAPKIKASIEFGKKKYWSGLSTSLKLGGKSLEKWFRVIHRDIVTIWGIYDPMNVLTSAAKEMSELQQELVDAGGGSLGRNMMRVGAIPAVAAGLSAALPPAAPVAVPIATGLVFATWVYNVVSVTPNVLRGMMGYIVDLTIVMQSLFFLTQARKEASGSGSHFPVNERLFKVALDAYKQDVEHSLQKVHHEIRSFVTVKKAIFKSETVIKEVERLINDHRFKPSERFMALARTNASN